MDNKCYGFITVTIITTIILWYKIVCLNKKILANNELVISLTQKLEDINDLNVSCMKLGIVLDDV